MLNSLFKNDAGNMLGKGNDKVKVRMESERKYEVCGNDLFELVMVNDDQ